MQIERKKRTLLDWFVLGVVIAIAVIVILLSFHSTSALAKELELDPYLTAGIVEVMFGTLLFIRGRQRALQRNVPSFLSIGYFCSLGFVTAVNMYGLSKENLLLGPIVGVAISSAMWLMETVLVWLWTESDRPHQKSLRELKREAEREIKEIKLRQEIEWMKWEAQKPDRNLVKKARKEEAKRRKIIEEGIPEYFQTYFADEIAGENQFLEATNTAENIEEISSEKPAENPGESPEKSPSENPVLENEKSKESPEKSPVFEAGESPKNPAENPIEKAGEIEDKEKTSSKPETKKVKASAAKKKVKKKKEVNRDLEAILEVAKSLKMANRLTRSTLEKEAETTTHYARKAMAMLEKIEAENPVGEPTKNPEENPAQELEKNPEKPKLQLVK